MKITGFTFVAPCVSCQLFNQHFLCMVCMKEYWFPNYLPFVCCVHGRGAWEYNLKQEWVMEALVFPTHIWWDQIKGDCYLSHVFKLQAVNVPLVVYCFDILGLLTFAYDILCIFILVKIKFNTTFHFEIKIFKWRLIN